MRHKHSKEDMIYTLALGLLKGIGPQIHRSLVSSFPTLQELEHASQQSIEKHFHSSVVLIIVDEVHRSSPHWRDLCLRAEETIDQHIQAGITPIPITSPDYPPLLKKISDPPALLYAKGDISLLQQPNSVAIVGTREPTQKGEAVARHLARHFARLEYTIVSGLAKGIDTAAHEGALDAGGKTIAVFGTPLDQVYPAANKELAQRIVATDGLLLSELPLGKRGFRSSFVSRDRIQSGLSLAVVPVQTTTDGGTMHTVNFAKAQNRLIACPIPLQAERQASQYSGIYALLRRRVEEQVYAFKAGQVEQCDIHEKLQVVKQQLLSAQQKHLNFSSQSQARVEGQGEGTAPVLQNAKDDASPLQKQKKQRSPSPSKKKTKTSGRQGASSAGTPSSMASHEVASSSFESRVAESGESYQGISCCIQPLLW